MKLNKKISLSILLLFTLTKLMAFDWGGELISSTTSSGFFDTLYLEETPSLVMWLRSPLDFEHNTYISGQGLFKTSWNNDINAFSFILDLNLLKFSMNIPLSKIVTTKFEMGRFELTDISGVILTQPADGLRFSFTTPNVSFVVYGGYTGLLNSKTVSINSLLPTAPDNSLYSLCNRYIIGNASLSLPQLLFSQSVTVEWSSFFDLNTTTNFNRHYVSLGLNGPFITPFYYVCSSSLEWKTGSSTPANLTKLEVSCYPDFLSSSLTISALYASGSIDTLSEFNTFSMNYANISKSIQYQSLLKGGFTGTIKPVNQLLILAQADAFYILPQNGVTSCFAGFQWLSSLRWQIVSDTTLTLSGGQFIPMSNSYNAYIFANLNVAITF